MAIDVNQEVKVWGGLTSLQFWAGVGGLLAIALVALLITLKSNAICGALFLGAAGGGLGIVLFQLRDLPKDYLKNRFRQEGKFLFVTVPGIHGTDLYAAPGSERGERFDREFENAG